MPAAANNEPFRRLCVKNRGRLRAGSDDHASAWPWPDGCLGWYLDAGDGRRRVCPRTRPGTWKGASRGAGSTASTTTGHGPSRRPTADGTSRRASIPSPGHAAAAGHGATSRAAYCLAATASAPAFRCPAAADGPAHSGAAARIPSSARGAATPGHGAAADAAYRRPVTPRRTAGRERAAVATGAD